MKRTRRISAYRRAQRLDMLCGLALMSLALGLLAAMPWLYPALAGAMH